MLASWSEWRAVCALDLCTETSRRRLRDFAHRRFGKFFERYARGQAESPAPVSDRADPAGAPSARDAWHLFETHLVVKSTRAGKRYKDWLFARVGLGGEPLDVIQGGASLIMRDVVREFMRQEFPHRDFRSMDRPVGSTAGERLTLADLLPGTPCPAQEAARHEYEELAQRHADELFQHMDRRERIVLLAKALGVSLASKAVEGATCVKKTRLSEEHSGLVRRIAGILRALYGDEDGEAVVRLTLMTLGRIGEMAVEWAQAEKCCPEFFHMSDGIASGGYT